jgi:hypothetical protein
MTQYSSILNKYANYLKVNGYFIKLKHFVYSNKYLHNQINLLKRIKKIWIKLNSLEIFVKILSNYSKKIN